MKTYLIVEGRTDAEILRRLIPPVLLSGVEFVEAQPLGSMASIARTLLVSRRAPTLVVMDAETNSPRLIRERRETMEELIGLVSTKTPTAVILAVPEIEAVFFHDPRVLERIVGESLSEDLIALGKNAPVEALRHLSRNGRQPLDTSTVLARLEPRDVEALRSAPVIKEVTEFLTRVKANAA